MTKEQEKVLQTETEREMNSGVVDNQCSPAGCEVAIVIYLEEKPASER